MKKIGYRSLEILQVQQFCHAKQNIWRVQCNCLFLYQPKPSPHGQDWTTCPACNKVHHLDYNAKIREYRAKGDKYAQV